MKHARSSAETEIRDAVVAWCRAELAGYRIVHELNVGGMYSCRADVAAVGTEELILFEIKSERDTLKRLDRQIKAFRAASHHAVVVAHRKWFEERVTTQTNGTEHRWLAPCEALSGLQNHRGLLWAYPAPDPEEMNYRWQLRNRWARYRQAQPRALDFLHLLWRDELAAEAARHGITANSRATIGYLIGEMCWAMTGQEIAQAVCRQLRARHFAEADMPITEHRSAA